MTSKLHTVFVYGTLKRGEPNHEWFSKDETGSYKYLGEAETVKKYPLIIATKYNIPFLLYKPDVGNNVRGEVYEVDDKVLKSLDILEDHPSFYEREINDVKLLNDARIIKSWIYFIKKFKPELLNVNFLKSYSNSGDHGLKYVTRYFRDPTYSAKSEILNDS